MITDHVVGVVTFPPSGSLTTLAAASLAVRFGSSHVTIFRLGFSHRRYRSDFDGASVVVNF